MTICNALTSGFLPLFKKKNSFSTTKTAINSQYMFWLSLLFHNNLSYYNPNMKPGRLDKICSQDNWTVSRV